VVDLEKNARQTGSFLHGSGWISKIFETATYFFINSNSKGRWPNTFSSSLATWSFFKVSATGLVGSSNCAWPVGFRVSRPTPFLDVCSEMRLNTSKHYSRFCEPWGFMTLVFCLDLSFGKKGEQVDLSWCTYLCLICKNKYTRLN